MKNFDGFTIPDGAWLPPELMYLLPDLTGAQLKITVAVLYHNLQVGGGQALSLTDLENLTGLSRQSVSTATTQLEKDLQILERIPVGRSFAYVPMVKNLDYPSQDEDPGDGSQPDLAPGDVVIHPSDGMVKNLGVVIESQLRESLIEGESDSADTDYLKNSGDGQKIRLSKEKIRLLKQERVQLLGDLRAAGVYLKTAQDLITDRDPEMIRKYLQYYKHALIMGMASGPGWLVLAIKEKWGIPLGFRPGSGGICVCPRCSTGLDRSDSESIMKYRSWESGG